MGLREYTRRPPDCLAWSAKRRLHRRSGGRGMREGEQARVGMGRGSIGEEGGRERRGGGGVVVGGGDGGGGGGNGRGGGEGPGGGCKGGVGVAYDAYSRVTEVPSSGTVINTRQAPLGTMPRTRTAQSEVVVCGKEEVGEFCCVDVCGLLKLQRSGC